MKDGADKNLIDRTFDPAWRGANVFPNLPSDVFNALPAVADFLNDGPETILFAAGSVSVP